MQSTSKQFFGLDSSSIVFTATDAGWINGHTYAFYGPLLRGSTTVISESLCKVSEPEYLNYVLYKCRVTCFYASVTLLRAIRQNVSKNFESVGRLFPDLERWVLWRAIV